jgi:uncharacterized repeat protein (TIGR01451 family)/LPXTG-motif cell wall-anchored protein
MTPKKILRKVTFHLQWPATTFYECWPGGGDFVGTSANKERETMGVGITRRLRRPLSAGLAYTAVVAATVVTSAVVATPAASPVQAAGTPVTDDFASGNYSGGSGWAAAWTETNDSTTAPIWTTGQIVVAANALQLTNIDNRSIQRTVNLSGFDEGAQLSFTVNSKSGDEALLVQFRTGNGASDFTTLATTTTGSIPAGTRYTYTLTPAMIRTAGELRILGADTDWQSDDVYTLDNIVIGNPVKNPNLAASCGLDMTVILDESGSIESPINSIALVEQAVDALALGLEGTGSKMRVVEFSTNARDAQIPSGNTGFQTVNNAYRTGPLNTYLTGTGLPSSPTSYQPDNDAPTGETFTNWEAGIYRAGTVPPSNYSPIPPLVVFITDGNPNTIGTAGTSTDNNGGGADNAAAAAVQEAEALKLAGAHMLGIGVGAAAQTAPFARLTNLIEPTGAQVWEGVGPLDLQTTDVIRVADFADLASALSQVASSLCSQSLVITKTDDAGNPLARAFTTTVTGQAGATQAFQWLSPADPTNPPPASKTVTSSGTPSVAEFKWTAVGRFATPATWTSTASFTEPVPPGWTVPAPSPCTRTRPGATDLSVPLSVSLSSTNTTIARTATFTLGGGYVFQAGDIVRCNITNTRPGKLTVDKVADPADNTVNFPFTWSAGAPFTLTNNAAPKDSGDIAPGTYTITEGPTTNWALKSVTCNGQAKTVTNGQISVDVAAGQTVNCVFSNEKAGKLIVQKASVGGTGAFGFTGAVSGTITTLTAGTTPTGNTLSADVVAGTYAVTESTIPTGWDRNTAVCTGGNSAGTYNAATGALTNIQVGPGQTVTCTFTNTKRATVTLKKATVNGDGTFGFTSAIPNLTGNITTVGGVTPGGSERVGSVVAGTYSITEGTIPAGWDRTSASCTGSTTAGSYDTGSGALTNIQIAAGQNVTCTFTNTRRSATLTLQKEWVNGASGDTTTISIDGTNDDSELLTANGTVGSEVEAATASTTVFAGETVTLKEVFGTNAAVYDATLSCGGVNVPLTNLQGTYTVPNTPTNVTCRFVNTARRGTIIIAKSAVGGSSTFAYTGNWAGAANFDITTGAATGTPPTSTGNRVFNNVLAGNYTVDETSPTPQWDLTSLQCVDSNTGGTASSPSTPTLTPTGTIRLDAGETVTCTYTNTSRGSITVVKNVTNTPTGTDPKTFNFSGTAPIGLFDLADDGAGPGNESQTFGNLTPGTFEISETNANTGGFSLSGINCGSATLGTPPTNGVAVQLQPGQNVTCTFTNQAQGSLTITKNDVTVPVQPVKTGTNTFTVSYDVVVANTGPGQSIYTLVDTPNFGAGATITNTAVTSVAPSPIVNISQNNANPVTIVTNQTIPGGATHTFRVTSTFTVAADMTPAERLCGTTPTAGQGTYNSATATITGGGSISAQDCVDIPSPVPTITKTVKANQPVAVDADTFTVAYDVVVTNPGPGQTTYTLTDTPAFGTGTTITNIAITGAANIPNYTSGAAIVTNKVINGPGSDTYTVTVTFDVAATTTATARDCTLQQGETGTGTLNVAKVTYPGNTTGITAQDCATIPSPVPTITKTVKANQPVAVDADTFTVAYDVVVTNPGPGQTTYTLTDTPAFGTGTTITNIAITGAANIPNYTSGAAIVTNKVINGPGSDTYTVTVTFDVAATTTATARDCTLQQGETGTGTLNVAKVTYPGNTTGITAQDCATIPSPTITVVKAVVAAPPQPVQVGTGFQYTVDYTLTVQNTGQGPGTYTLTDTPNFGAGVTVNSIAYSGPTNGTLPITGGTIVTARPIASGVTEVFTVKVTFTVPASLSSTLRDCVQETTGVGTGTLNGATATPNIGSTSTSTACVRIPDPDITVAKTVTSGPLYDAGSESFTVTYDVVATNNGAGPGTFTMIDTPAFGAGTNISSITVASTDFTANSPLPNTGGTIVTNEALAAGASKKATVTITFTVDGDMSADARDCDLDDEEDGTGTLNRVSVTVNPGTNPPPAEDCVEIPNPGISVTKLVKTPPAQPVQVGTGFQYTVDYTITVQNTGGAPGSYTLTDSPTFGDGTTLDAIALVAPVPSGTNPDFDLDDLAIVKSSKSIAVGGIHVYTVRVTFTVEGSTTTTARDCVEESSENGTGTLNTATVTPSIGSTPPSSDCAVIPDPLITVEKTVASGPTLDETTGEYTITYDVDVTNDGDGPGTFTLTDTPAFGANTSLVSVSATSSDFTVDPGFSAPGGVIVSDEPIAAGDTKSATVTVVFTIDAAATVEDRDCDLDEGEDGTGSLNRVVVDPNIGGDDDGEACEELPDPLITVDKEVTSGPTQSSPGSSTWTVGYDIVISNDGDGPGTYDLTDVPAFASGITITAREATSSDIAINGDFNTDLTSSSIATDVEIAGQTEQTVAVLITFTLPGTVDPDDRECGEPATPGKGTYNTATVTPNIGDPDDGVDCGDLPLVDIDVTKTVPSPAVNNGDGTFTVEYSIDVTTSATSSPTTYDLSDTPGFGPGIVIESLAVVNTTPGSIMTNPSFGESDPVIIEGQAIAGNTTHTYVVTAVVSTDFDEETVYVPCSDRTGEDGEGLFNRATITVEGADDNSDICTDLPGDLEIVKTDGDAIAIAGGDPFTYTLTITNVGGLSTGEPVIVKDVLPEEFEWVSYPEGPALPACEQGDPDVNVLTCELDPATVDLGGKSTQLVLEARAKADTAVSGVGYENLSYVDSPLDPAPETPECPSTTPEDFSIEAVVEALVEAVDTSGNNVSCDSTPVDGDATITVTKVDSIADGQLVNQDQPFSYTIQVTNNGPSPVTNVTITDEIPVGLVLDSAVGGAGWNACSTAGGIVECTYPGPLAPGASTSAVTVDVTVDLPADTAFRSNGATPPTYFIDNVVDATAEVEVLDDEGDPTTKVVEDSDTEETPFEPSLGDTGGSGVCRGDAPIVNYTIETLGIDPDPFTATVTVRDVNGDLVTLRTATGAPLANPFVATSRTGSFLYPGANVDADGEATDWPGWKFQNGRWVVDPSDAFLRDGLEVTVEVNPTVSFEVSYPPASSACADPTQVSADLAIQKVTSDATPAPGETFDWTLTVTNLGPDTATNVVVADTVPAPLTVTGVASDVFDCSRSGNKVTCTTPSFAKGATGTITIRSAVPNGASPGTITNVATVTSQTPDPNPANNRDDATVTIQAVVLPPPPPGGGELPPTGGDIGRLIQLAGVAIATGLGLLFVRRRRRNATAAG